MVMAITKANRVGAGFAASQDDGLTGPSSGQLHILAWPGAALQLASLQHQHGPQPHEAGQPCHAHAALSGTLTACSMCWSTSR